eukprot:1007102-Amphidinium_carterae.1
MAARKVNVVNTTHENTVRQAATNASGLRSQRIQHLCSHMHIVPRVFLMATMMRYCDRSLAALELNEQTATRPSLHCIA